MTQIAFLTLFLGLTLGPQPVELTVSGPVAAVELLLDGSQVARLTGAPWSGRIDFGPVLLPHELVARAVDEQGNEIGRTRQWVNLPRPPAEVEILFDGGSGGRPTAGRLTWQSLTGESPSAIAVTFDGKPLVLGAEGRIQLPAYNPETTHVLSVELRFSGSLTARKDVAFGGDLGDEVSTELTAVPVRLRRGQKMPSADRMQGWFLAGGRPLTVAAVEEEGPAQLFVVRDLATDRALSQLDREGDSRSIVAQAQRDSESRRFLFHLDKEATVRFIWPLARSVPGSSLPAELFSPSRDFDQKDGGLLWLLTRALPPGGDPGQQRLADAAAVAGLQALYGNHRRAVLMVLGDLPIDASRSNPAMLRRYLEAIRVPLIVWTLGDSMAVTATWGAAEEVSSSKRLQKAFARLERELAAQSIVWVDGRHLPQGIELAPAGTGVLELVR